MFCPVCKAEYRFGFIRCSDCGVDLVEKLEAIQSPAEAGEDDDTAYELLWAGIDPRIFQEYRYALQAEQISFQERPPGSPLLYQSLRPPMEIWTRRHDHEAVDKVRRQILGDEDEPAEQNSKGVAENESSRAPDSVEYEGESDDSAKYSESSVPDDIVGEFLPEDANAEVWSGEDAQMKDMLILCLRGNGIGSVVDDADGKSRIRVLPSTEARAREIIREVVEATPPE
jgi:hypothetical protein